MPPGSRRNVNWNLFTAILNLLKPRFKKRYRTSFCNLLLMRFLVSKTSQNRPSHSRLNLKIFAVPYLSLAKIHPNFCPNHYSLKSLFHGQFIAANFLGQYFQSAGSSWTTNNLEFRYSMCPKPMSPKTRKNSAELSIAWQTECKSHEIWCPRYLAMN